MNSPERTVPCNYAPWRSLSLLLHGGVLEPAQKMGVPML